MDAVAIYSPEITITGLQCNIWVVFQGTPVSYRSDLGIFFIFVWRAYIFYNQTLVQNTQQQLFPTSSCHVPCSVASADAWNHCRQLLLGQAGALCACA